MKQKYYITDSESGIMMDIIVSGDVLYPLQKKTECLNFFDLFDCAPQNFNIMQTKVSEVLKKLERSRFL